MFAFFYYKNELKGGLSLKIDTRTMINFYKKIDKSFEVTVIGSSMQPILNQGDKVRINREEDYKVGDIILFRYRQEGNLIHRIIGIENGIFCCKGDNAIRIEYILPRHILGKVIFTD